MTKFKQKLDKFFESKWSTVCFLLFICLIATLFFGRLIFTDQFMAEQGGQDSEYHINVLIALDELFSRGQLFSKIMPNILSDLGYGTQFFYGTLPHIITILIKHLFGCSLTTAIKIVVITFFILSGIVMYMFLLRVFKRKKGAMIGAIIYICTPYYMADFYNRFAFSELFMFTFIVLAFWSIWEYVNGDIKHFYVLFILGFSCSLLTHLALTIWVALLCVAYMIFNYKKVFVNKKWVHFLIASAVVLGITAYFTLPMLECMLVGYRVNNSSIMNTHGYNAYDNTQFLITSFPWDFGYGNIIPFTTFVLDVVVIICAFVYFKQRQDEAKEQWLFCIVITLFLIFMLTKLAYVWVMLEFVFSMIQFSWRLNMFIGFAIAILSTSLVRVDLKSTKKSTVLVVGAICLALCASPMTAYSVQFTTWADESFLSQGYCTFAGAGYQREYLPKVAGDYAWNNFDDKIVVDTTNEIFGVAVDDNTISFEINGDSNYEAYVAKVNTLLPYDSELKIKVYEIERHWDCLYDANVYNIRDIVPANNEGLLTIESPIGSVGSIKQKIVIYYSDSEIVTDYMYDNNAFVNVVSGDLVMDNFSKDTPSMSFDVLSVEDNTKIELPLIYYKGYNITLNNDNGSKRLDYTMSENGFIEISLSDIGSISVEYEGTTIVKLSSLLSRVAILMTVTGGVSYFLYEILKKKKDKIL